MFSLAFFKIWVFSVLGYCYFFSSTFPFSCLVLTREGLPTGYQSRGQGWCNGHFISERFPSEIKKIPVLSNIPSNESNKKGLLNMLEGSFPSNHTILPEVLFIYVKCHYEFFSFRCFFCVDWPTV